MACWKEQKGINFPMEAIMKVYPLLNNLSTEKEGFYSVINFLSILYELSLLKIVELLPAHHLLEPMKMRIAEELQKYMNT